LAHQSCGWGGFRHHAGQIHALLGANGAGKSTLIAAFGAAHHRRGEILSRASDFSSDRQVADCLYPSDLGLFDWMTVAENVAMGAVVIRGAMA
jgi:ribose transport system ATP-binding protein